MLVALKDLGGDLFVIDSDTIEDINVFVCDDGTECAKITNANGYSLVPGTVEELIIRLNRAGDRTVTFI